MVNVPKTSDNLVLNRSLNFDAYLLGISVDCCHGRLSITGIDTGRVFCFGCDGIFDKWIQAIINGINSWSTKWCFNEELEYEIVIQCDYIQSENDVDLYRL